MNSCVINKERLNHYVRRTSPYGLAISGTRRRLKRKRYPSCFGKIIRKRSRWKETNNEKSLKVWRSLLVLVHSRVVTDATAEHHGEDHLEDLNGQKDGAAQHIARIWVALLSGRCLAKSTLQPCETFICVLTHHDDSDHQSGQTDQVQLLREQLDQFAVTALGGGRNADVDLCAQTAWTLYLVYTPSASSNINTSEQSRRGKVLYHRYNTGLLLCRQQ